MGLIDSILGAGADFLSYTPWSWVDSAVEAGLDSLGLSQHGRDQYFQRSLQREMLESQQNFQREMTDKSFEFSRGMYDKQWLYMLNLYPQLAQRLNDQQFNLWRQQFNMQNEWNESMYQKYQSPQAVVSQNAAAGLNPAGLNGVNNGVSANTMGASSAATPPHINPVPFGANGSPVGLGGGYVGNMRDSLSSIGSFLRDVAEAKKKGVETDHLVKLFDYEVEERAQRIFGQRLTNDSIALANYVANNTKDVKVRRATQELVKLVAETENVEQDTQLKFEQMWKERSQYLLNIAKKNLSDKEYEVLEFKVNNLDEEFRTTMSNIRADTNKKISETRLNNAIRETENQLREGKVECQQLGNELQRIGNELSYNDLWISNRTIDAKVTGLMHSLEREGIITKQEAEKLYQMSVSSDWAERQQFIQYVGATATAVGNVLSGTGSVISGAASWKNAKWNNLNFQQRNQITRDIGEERNRILDDYQKGVKDAKRSSILGPDWEMYSDQWSR